MPALADRMTTPADLPTGHGAPTRVVLLETATPDVSSTMIRDRAARGASLTGLVTAPVAQYIQRHGLYAA